MYDNRRHLRSNIIGFICVLNREINEHVVEVNERCIFNKRNHQYQGN
jgi:hypothetical protein